jgi:serine/threonine protein kinase
MARKDKRQKRGDDKSAVAASSASDVPHGAEVVKQRNLLLNLAGAQDDGEPVRHAGNSSAVAAVRSCTPDVQHGHDGAAANVPSPKQLEPILGPAGSCLASGAFLGEWQASKLLGGGTYGQVFEVVDRVGGLCLAAKVAVREGTLQDLDSECRLLRRLIHPNIVQSYGLAASGLHAALLMELAQSDLASWLALPANKLVEREDWKLMHRWRLLFQIVSALHYMHNNNVLHLDLKTNNMLVFEDRGASARAPQSRSACVKLADLGLSQAMTGTTLSVVGDEAYTANFRAPELIFAQRSRTKISFPTDVFALGCCVYDLFRNANAGPLLFPNKSLFEHMLLVKQRQGANTALQVLARARDQRVGQNKCGTEKGTRINDALAVRTIKDTVVSVRDRITLHGVRSHIGMAMSSLGVSAPK